MTFLSALCLPGLLFRRQIVQADIGIVSCFSDLPLRQSLADSAVRLFDMGAVQETTLPYIGRKLGKVKLKLLLCDRLHHLDLKGRKAGRIGNKGAPAERKKFDMSSR